MRNRRIIFPCRMGGFSVIGFSVLLILPFSRPDSLDDIRTKADTVAQRASQRCSSVPNNEKVLPRNAISDLPLPFDPQGPIPEFRASMYEAQKIAVNRAIFFSYILQQAELDDEPDMGYYFYSTLATLSSSDDKIMGSKIVFSKDMLMSSWYGGLNQTLPFFGPYAFKRFNTSQMLFAIDLGADPSFAYTDELKHITPNPWYAAWLSERTSVELPQPALLELKVLKDNSGMETINFFGPPVELPAIWTMPFFDCLFTDKWQLSVTAPIADLDRATRLLTKRQAPGATTRQAVTGNFVNVQENPASAVAPQQLPTIASYIAAVSVEMDYKKIDINQCDAEHQFNTFAGTHKCKRETTMCEPLHGHGLRRGGYQCVCKSGFKYPSGRAVPYSGGEVESASAVDYAKADAFQCIPIQGQEVLMSPALSAQTAISSSVNAIPTNAGAESRTPLPPPARPANFQQPFPTQAPLQADAVPNQPQNFLPFSPEQNTIRPFATFAPILTRPTPPMQSLPPQTNSPFRPNPSFSQSQPAPVPNAPNFFQGSQSQAPFQQPLPVPQFMPQPINQSSRAGPPQLPNFSPSHGQQFFDPQQFQLRPDNLGPPQQIQESNVDPQRMPQVPQFHAAASRQEMHFAPQFVPPQFDPATQRFNRDIPPRRIRQVPDQDLPTSASPQNAAVIQQLIQKLAQENNLMFRARQMLDNLSPRNCSANRFAEKVDLGFSQEFGRKIGKQFATQGRSALRLSHFLSNYLQNGIAVEGKRRNKLTENMILGEMAAMIIAEPAIGAVSVQFEEGVFPGRRFFAPTALYNKMLDELQFYHYPDNYTSFDWYRDIKTKTAATRLADFAVDIKMRVDAAGSRFTDVPTQSFKAITFDDIKSPYGPYYDCFYLDKFFWFEVPFFAKKSEGAIQFGGLISVGINPDQIDVNQCSSAEEPLFRGTDRCDRQSTTCVPFAGRGFRAGGYKCVCKEGFEYPYIDSLQYFDGLAVEIEYQNKLLDFPNNFAHLRCRRPGQKLHADTLPAAPPNLPAQTQRQPVPPSTFAPARTLQTSSTQKVVHSSLAADNSPWIPTIPITMAPTTATTTTTMSPIPPNFHPNQFAPQPNFPPNNFVPSTGFGPQPQRPNSPATNPFPNNFTPANSPRPPVPPRTPNVPVSSTFSAPFQPLPQRPIPPQSFDGSSLIPDQQPSDITNMNAPQFGETEQGTSNNFGGSFVPSFLTETFQTTPSTTSTTTTTTTTRRPTITTTTTTPTTTTTTSTTPLTTSTTTTTTTTTTPPSTSDLVVVEIATETPDIGAIATTATMEDLDDSITSSPTDAETTSSTSVITRLVTKHGPTKYTIKVVKGTTSGNLDAEASNEIKRERRIQKKGPNSGNLSSRTSFPLILLSFFSFILLRY